MRKLFIFILTIGLAGDAYAKSRFHAVTYEQGQGRFGDKLLAYIHAKWISYKYKMPLLYKSFNYSDQLMLDTCEQRYRGSREFQRHVIVWSENDIDLSFTESTLFVIPYFPESKWELANNKDSRGQPWRYFEVDWSDAGFIAELRRMIAPVKPIPPLSLPHDRISVAVHVRRGGYHEATRDGLKGFPLKFLSDETFVELIRKLYDMLGGQPLYVHLFTDDLEPARMMEAYRGWLSGLDIQFGGRTKNNSDLVNVIEDFFALGQFDCLIHSESNYSLIMSKISNHIVSMCPDSFHKNGSKVIYDSIKVTRNRVAGT